MAEENKQPDELRYMEHVIKVFQSSSIPLIKHAVVSNVAPDGNLVIVTKWQQLNYVTSTTDHFSVLYNYKKDDNLLLKIDLPIETNHVLLEAVSPSLKQRAVIKKKVNDTTKKEEYVFELWSNSESKRTKVINLSSIDIHGQVHSDALFGRLCWSGDETKVAYVAEEKKMKSSGYFERPSETTGNDHSVQGERYVYEESWGEQLTDVTNTVLCVLNLLDNKLSLVKGVPENISPLQPEFGPNDTLLFAGLQKLPFRLGAIYCENRVGGIYLVKLGSEEEAVEITASCTPSSNHQPRVNKGNTKCVFLHRKLSGHGDTHRGSHSLMMYDFETKSLKLICNQLESIVRGENMKTSPLNIIAMNVHYNYWLSDDMHIALPVIHEGKTFACIINTSTGELSSMTECSTLLGTFNNMVLVSYQKLNFERCSLMVIDSNNPSKVVIVKEGHKVDEEIEINSLVDKHGMTSFYAMPKTAPALGHDIPVIVIVHGGPHGMYTNDFSRNARLFCKLGYAVLLVNYRGSFGFTNESLNSLPGKIGQQDVEDVQNIVLQFIELKKESVDPKNIFIFGGSHGGFLGLHLVGQFPDFYCAAVLLNPVVEVSSMAISSDIPDWDYVESGLGYTQDLLPTNASLTCMLSKSPIIHIASINTPILLCIGDKDQRVPPSQGKHLFRVLKANKKVVKMLLYPKENHPLSSAEADGDWTVNMCCWFYRYRSHSR